MSETRLVVGRRLRVVTESSVWELTPHTYQRISLDEHQHSDASDRGDLRYNVLHGYTDAFLVQGEHGARIRILPVGRPPDAFGVLTGYVQRIEVYPDE
jgi:hypothetical protein